MIEIKLTKGYTAIVDDEDADLAQHKWCAQVDKDGHVYAVRDTGGQKHRVRISLHIAIAERLYGAIPKGVLVDHQNTNSLDDTRGNLRLATRSENCTNSRLCKRNTSGFKGVHLNKKTGRWRATIRADKKPMHLGYFDTPEAAFAAYCEAARKYHGEFARFN